MKQQTSIDWFIDNLPERFKNAIVNTCKEEIEQAKQMGKEQIVESWNDGNLLGRNGFVLEDYSTGKQYYKEKYGE